MHTSKSLGPVGILILTFVACEAADDRAPAKELVTEAIAHVQEKGSAAFADFRTKDSRWFQGDSYVFVSDLTGTVLVQPADASMEGKNQIDLKDPDGREIVREMLDVVKKDGSGWIDYRWPKPGATEPSDKSTFVMKTTLDGREIIIGSGVYR